MMQIDPVDWLRAVLILGTLIVFVVLGWRFILGYRKLFVGRKLLFGSMLCLVLASGVRSYEAMQDNDGFKLTLIPFAAGVILALVYLTKPDSRWDDIDEGNVLNAELRRQMLDEIASLKASRGALSDTAYDLARRNNELEIERTQYLGDDADGVVQ